jgi:hypothetical protein
MKNRAFTAGLVTGIIAVTLLAVPSSAKALPHVVSLPAEARPGVQSTGTEKDGVIDLELKLDEKIIDAKIVEVRLTVVDQLPNWAYREIVDLRLGTHRDKKGLVMAHFSLERKLAAAATISLVIDQERNLPGGTWYVFGLDDFLDLFNAPPAWKLRQKLRAYESTSLQRESLSLERQKELLESKVLDRRLQPTPKEK